MKPSINSIKTYFAAVGLFAHIALVFLGYSVYSQISHRAEPLPQTLQRIGHTINKEYPSVAIAGDTLLDAGETLHSKNFFWREFDSKNWPTVGPNFATAYADLPDVSRSILVDNEQEIIKAINTAQPGTEIIIKNGDYYLEQKRINSSLTYPTSKSPIIVRAETAGKVNLELTTLEGLFLNRPNWIITGLRFIGNCQPHCEHAIHIVGHADNLQVSHNEFVDFNAAIKVNGVDRNYPDFGKVSHNYFYFTEPSESSSSVTPVNLDSGNSWVLSNNIIRDFIKLGGNQVSYGAFIKGGANNGAIENNLIVCNSTNNDYGGYQVGVSLGGGGMKRATRRDKANYETNLSVIRNNIMMHCNDVGVYINQGKDTIVNNNILYNTNGIDVRFKQSTALVTNNILSGDIRKRDKGVAETISNTVLRKDFWRGGEQLDGWFKAPAVGNFTPSKTLAKSEVPYPFLTTSESTGKKPIYDFCGNTILDNDAFIGAFKDALNCFKP
ncbi:chondroitinase-B domain-containing protein [Photobacterium kagoshimensis]|uniref:chondroitinase-B domain-containing protein n=1 Tax=Photobacterium kagoshimensis TaxID=2910242 RepID=UPI003D0C827C